MNGNERVAKSLGYAGLIPFVVFSTGSWLKLPLITSSQDILIAYAAVILSFMGAVYWGVALTKPETPVGKYFLVSITPALIAWVTLLKQGQTSIIILMIGFIALLFFEWSTEKTLRLPDWYLPLRNTLTSIVMICLILAFLSYSI